MSIYKFASIYNSRYDLNAYSSSFLSWCAPLSHESTLYRVSLLLLFCHLNILLFAYSFIHSFIYWNTLCIFKELNNEQIKFWILEILNIHYTSLRDINIFLIAFTRGRVFIFKMPNTCHQRHYLFIIIIIYKVYARLEVYMYTFVSQQWLATVNFN